MRIVVFLMVVLPIVQRNKNQNSSIASTPSNAGEASAVDRVTAASRLRLYKLGDQWVYYLAGDVALNNGSVVNITNGAATESITDCFAQNGQNYFKVTTEAKMSLRGVSHSVTTRAVASYMQDPLTRCTYKIGDSYGAHISLRQVKGTYQIYMPGAFSASTSVNNTITFDNGESTIRTAHVYPGVGQTSAAHVTIWTQIGVFTGWYLYEDEAKSNGNRDTTTGTFVPSIGQYISETDVVHTVSNTTTLSFSLTSTNTN